MLLSTLFRTFRWHSLAAPSSQPAPLILAPLNCSCRDPRSETAYRFRPIRRRAGTIALTPALATSQQRSVDGEQKRRFVECWTSTRGLTGPTAWSSRRCPIQWHLRAPSLVLRWSAVGSPPGGPSVVQSRSGPSCRVLGSSLGPNPAGRCTACSPALLRVLAPEMRPRS